MEAIVKGCGIGIVVFSVVLASFVGTRVDQTTVALLGGTFIGLLVGVPTVLLVVLISHRRRDEAQQQPPPQRLAQTTTHVIERQFVLVVPVGATQQEKYQAVQMLQPGITIKHAKQLLLEGKVKVVER